MRLKGFNGQLEFYNVDELETMVMAEHFMVTDIEWDPTGRYVATSVTSVHEMENGFNIWSFNGKLLYRILKDHFFQSAAATRTTDRVFDPACLTEVVYEEGVKNVALSALMASMFAYGQTSSGKTYTMRGITEKVVNDIYRHIVNNSGLEIYNENVRDLLNLEFGRNLKALEAPEKGTVVRKLVEETTNDDQHLRHLISIYEAQRQVGEIALNDTSSRSHQIIRLIIMGRKRKPDHPRHMMSDVIHNRTSVAPPSEEASHRPLSEGPLVAPQQLPCTQPPRLPSVCPPSVPPQQLSSSAYEPSAGHVSSSSTSTRRGRGCAEGIKEWGTGKKLDIQFDGNYCPIGDNVAKLTTQLGIIVRNGNIVPLTFLDWNNVPDDIIDAIWKDVKYWRTSDAEMTSKGESTDKMNVWLMTRRVDDPEDEFNRQLSMLPEDGRTLEARNAIFHELIGHDGHGYCRTYGRIVPRREVYKDGAGPSQSTPQPSTIDQITQKVRAELRDELREELRAEFSTHLQQMRAEMMALVSQGASVDPNRQFLWRPRAPSILSVEKEEEIVKNLKKYSKKYEAEDQDMSLLLSEQDREKQRMMMEEWDRWVDEWKRLREEEKLERQRLRDVEASDEEEYEVKEVEVEESLNVSEEVVPE
ncbi:unnamed protein product [Camellia sinensis]